MHKNKITTGTACVDWNAGGRWVVLGTPGVGGLGEKGEKYPQSPRARKGLCKRLPLSARVHKQNNFIWNEDVIVENIFLEELFENMYMYCRKGWGSSFDQGESNGADVRSVGFGFWPIRTHDSDRARGRGVGVHRPRFSGHTAFVSEPCALWKHLHYLTSYFCFEWKHEFIVSPPFFSTVRNHEYSGECHILVSWIYSTYDTTFN